MHVNGFKAPAPATTPRPPARRADAPSASDVFSPTGIALTGAGMAMGALAAAKLVSRSLPPQAQTAIGVMGAVVGGAVGLGLGVPAGKAMDEAVRNPSLANSAKSGAWMGGALGLMGAAAMLTGTAPSVPQLADLAVLVGGGAGMGTVAAGLVHGTQVLKDRVLEG